MDGISGQSWGLFEFGIAVLVDSFGSHRRVVLGVSISVVSALRFAWGGKVWFSGIFHRFVVIVFLRFTFHLWVCWGVALLPPLLSSASIILNIHTTTPHPTYHKSTRTHSHHIHKPLLTLYIYPFTGRLGFITQGKSEKGPRRSQVKLGFGFWG